MKSGYFGIGIWQPQHECNIGTLFRSAYIFGADFIFTIGRKYKKQSSDTIDSTRHIPCYRYMDSDSFLAALPNKSRLVNVEITPTAYDLKSFCHPKQAIYLLGSEGQTLPARLLDAGITVKIPDARSMCLNVSTAGSIVMYDRIAKM